MRLPLGSCRFGSQLGCQSPNTRAVVAASVTLTQVLGEDSPLPESAADVDDLVCLLRGHVAQLGTRIASGNAALLRAQRLCSESIPEGYMPSRVYLVRLAEATQELMPHVKSVDPGPVNAECGQRWPRPTVKAWRGAVFALTLACLLVAASVPRT
ncbi:DUF6415 family natural product biosynthesis protein [Streptomyces sp. DSM 41014]|uniref:DUF6415 family natural product biosynthesis protein n=1 Tax=Streptomyces hintoniae TaxID=3075521 RepID=A0ABU2UGF7_9ACTN|nr:DUF6415 family natural product biosynthesis protein [Streptomyces sp. DSM 41014]MDT0472338.1 DUF6415 family natural product biosynthesis protein [Streptomyces sp. DSM 41014]